MSYTYICVFTSHTNLAYIFQVQVLRCDHSVLSIKKHMCARMGKGQENACWTHGSGTKVTAMSSEATTEATPGFALSLCVYELFL